MATPKVITFDPFKRGDTPVFSFIFTEPFSGFDWSTATADAAMTDVESPNDNSGAALLRLNQTLTVDDSNNATLTFQPTPTESKNFTPDTTYSVEVQLKDGGGNNIATAVTGNVNVLQDFVI